MLTLDQPEIVANWSGGDAPDSYITPLRLLPVDKNVYQGNYGEDYVASLTTDGQIWTLNYQKTGDDAFQIQFTAPYTAGQFPPCWSDDNENNAWTQVINTLGSDMQFLAYVFNNRRLV